MPAATLMKWIYNPDRGAGGGGGLYYYSCNGIDLGVKSLLSDTTDVHTTRKETKTNTSTQRLSLRYDERFQIPSDEGQLPLKTDERHRLRYIYIRGLYYKTALSENDPKNQKATRPSKSQSTRENTHPERRVAETLLGGVRHA